MLEVKRSRILLRAVNLLNPDSKICQSNRFLNYRSFFFKRSTFINNFGKILRNDLGCDKIPLNVRVESLVVIKGPDKFQTPTLTSIQTNNPNDFQQILHEF